MPFPPSPKLQEEKGFIIIALSPFVFFPTVVVGVHHRLFHAKQMPLFPDVDVVLFELLLVSTTRDPEDACTGLESIDATGDNFSNSGRSPHLGGPCTVESTNNRSTPNVGVGGGENSPIKSQVTNCPGGDGPTDSPSCTFVGAVALLLSEVVGAWRAMESPLFDSAGGVAGTIKVAARLLDGEATTTQAAENTSVQESNRDVDEAEAKTTAAHRDTESKSLAAGAPVPAEAVTSPSATSGLVISQSDDGSSANRTAKSKGGRCDRRVASAPTSPCCDRSSGSSRGSHGPAPTGRAQEKSLSSCTAAALEGRQFEPVRAGQMAPRATIIYRGVKLPFRWFRSGTVKGMDETLREMLGEGQFQNTFVWKRMAGQFFLRSKLNLNEQCP